MIRFVDVRGQGLRARFSFWTTVIDRFLSYSGNQAWSTWEDFRADFTASTNATPQQLQRYRSLCPAWVFDPPTDAELAELDFPDPPPPSRLRIEHSVVDLSALPRRRQDEASNDVLWGDLYHSPVDLECTRPLIDLREISRFGCRYVIASRMYRTSATTSGYHPTEGGV